MNALPIGVFDSGVGGLTVLRALQQRLPAENFIYLGDTARLPYGTKSAETIVRYARQAAAVLQGRGIKMLVVACNTASAHALPALCADEALIPVIGVIEPGARAAVQATKNRHIAVIATESTIAAGAYTAAIHKLASDITVSAQACSLLVALAEEGWTEGREAEAIVRRYLTPLLAAHSADTLVLGCTHFPLLAPVLQKVAGPAVCLIDSAETTAIAVENTLIRLNLKHEETGYGTVHFMATDGAARFARVAGQFLGRAVSAADVEIVNL